MFDDSKAFRIASYWDVSARFAPQSNADEEFGARLTAVDGARAVGLMETSLKTTVEYLKVRKQFGVTINKFQALTHRAAQMYSDVELARSTSLWATAVAEAFPGTVDTLSAEATERCLPPVQPTAIVT